MTISIINGSPKFGSSTSGMMIEYLAPKLSECKIDIYHINKAPLTEMQLEQVRNSDILVFAFPLYIDSIPSHLLKQLITLETQDFRNKNTKVYCMVTSGFYEGKQNHIAIEQMQHWCCATKLTWGQAIGSGAGEMLPFIKDIPLGHGTNKNLGNAINELVQNILSGKSGDTLYVSPNFPRFLWRICGSVLVWNPRAKANGLKRKDMFKQLH